MQLNMHASWLSLYQPVGIGTGLTKAIKLTSGFAVKVGRYGGLEEEVEHLKRDKNVLMLELVRLRQQQQENQVVLQLKAIYPVIQTRGRP